MTTAETITTATELQSDRAVKTVLADGKTRHNLLEYFGLGSISLGFKIIETKPGEVSVKDHIFSLCKSKHTGILLPPSERRYIDSYEFVRDAYNQECEKNRELEKRNRFLEEQIRTITEGGKDGSQRGKGNLHSNTKSEISQELATWIDDTSHEASYDMSNQLRLSSIALQIVRQRQKLILETRDCSLPDKIDSLSKSCTEATHILSFGIEEACKKLWFVKTCDKTSRALATIQYFMHQAFLCYQASFVALCALCSTILGRKSKDEVISKMLKCFKTALNHLIAVCEIQTKHEQERAPHGGQTEVDSEEYAVTKYLARAISSMTQLDWSFALPGHAELLEGMLYLVLQHSGRLISLAIFKEHVAVSDLPGNITKRDPGPRPEMSKLEAKYLIQILHTALGTTSERRSLIAAILVREPLLTTLDGGCNHGILLSQMRKKIQQALLRSSVGAEEMQGLQMPVDIPVVEVNVQIEVEQYGEEWLLAAIGSLVGW